jgi:hypothetical protein
LPRPASAGPGRTDKTIEPSLGRFPDLHRRDRAAQVEESGLPSASRPVSVEAGAGAADGRARWSWTGRNGAGKSRPCASWPACGLLPRSRPGRIWSFTISAGFAVL